MIAFLTRLFASPIMAPNLVSRSEKEGLSRGSFAQQSRMVQYLEFYRDRSTYKLNAMVLSIKLMHESSASYFLFIFNLYIKEKKTKRPGDTHVKSSIFGFLQPDSSLKFGDELLIEVDARVRVPSQAEYLPEDDSEGPDVTLCGENAVSQAF